MGEYHHSAHAVWDIKYHLVWITKYRYKVLRGEVAERARDLLREICAAREVRIVRGRCRPTTYTCWWWCRRSWRRPSWCGS
jgi:putative transposase